MKIIDLTTDYQKHYFACLEGYSEEMKEAGDIKETWFKNMQDKGLIVKLAVTDDNKTAGFIQLAPIEQSHIGGEDLYFIYCVWVHGYKNKGVGNQQQKGIGSKLLLAAESEAKQQGVKGIAAWGISLPFWMKASWFKKHGYIEADKDGLALLLWKKFTDDATAPKWIKRKKTPQPVQGKVSVTCFVNGWCPAQNIVYNRTKQAIKEIDSNKIEFQVINTLIKENFLEWGISDGVFIDGKLINTGPPVPLKKIKKIIEKKIKKL